MACDVYLIVSVCVDLDLSHLSDVAYVKLHNIAKRLERSDVNAITNLKMPIIIFLMCR